MGRLALLLVLASALDGQEDPLAAIHRLLVPMRTAHLGEARGATPALTSVKHQLRDWIESRLPAMQWKDSRWIPDPTILQEQLNEELNQADLFCPQIGDCWENRLGYLDRIALEVEEGFLVVRTSIGIQVCGTDDSAYIYELSDVGWGRIWQSEQDNYEERAYSPQRLVDVKISPTDWNPESDKSEHLIVTTGVLPWCSSVWQPVYYRVWQTKSAYSTARLQLDQRDQIDIGEPIFSQVNQKDVFIEYQIIIDEGNRVSELKHYVFENGKLKRTDPVAVTPKDFVSFWLRGSWEEVSAWTAEAGRAGMEAWHEKYKGTVSEFAAPSRHCTLHPDLWQVATHQRFGVKSVRYFLIRPRLPFRFTMIAASDRPWPDCRVDDPAIDKAFDMFGFK